MNKRIITCVVLCFVVLYTYCQNTIYYKLTNIHNNVSSMKIQGGQFITFCGDICYESDYKGIGVGHGTMTYNPNYSSSSVKKYMGSSYFGEDAVYAFSSDKSVLNVILENGMVLVYKRSSPPNDVYTCSLIKSKNTPSNSSSTSSSSTSYPVSNTYPSITPSDNSASTTKANSSPRKSWKTVSYTETCGSCHGSGKCWTCNGKGWCRNEFGLDGTHDCPNCINGVCSHCNGTGKITKTKQVYE